MIAFDTLSELESYAGAFPAIGVITGVMDRSLPYDQGAGRYDTPEKSDVSYIIDEFLTSQRGFPAETHDGNLVMEIVLEGEELISVSGSVFRMETGRFLIYSGSDKVQRALMYSLPEHTKAVRFIF